MPSQRERTLPMLFAAMEACWIAATLMGLASINFLGTNAPLIPLWLPFILLTGSCWLTQKVKSGKISSWKNMPLIALTALILVGLIIVGTLWTFKLDLYSSCSIAVLVFCLCLRGSYLSYRGIHPSYATKTFRFGIGIVIVAILMRSIRTQMGVVFHDDFVLLLILSLLVSLWLITHALANIVYVRDFHPSTEQNEHSAIQERNTMFVVIATSLILVVLAFIVGSIINPTLLTDVQGPLQNAYLWSTSVIAHGLTLLFTPIVWLLYFLHFQSFIVYHSSPSFRGNGPPPQIHLLPPKNRTQLSISANALALLQGVLEIALPILLLVIAILLIRRFLLFLKKSALQEQHESLWSWSTFWNQLSAFFLALFNHFFPLHAKEQIETDTHIDQIESESRRLTPTMESIREIYRALLKKAAHMGYPRQHNETPYEFRERLGKQFPLFGMQLYAITEAYIAARYSNVAPDEAEIAQMQGIWLELERQWQ